MGEEEKERPASANYIVIELQTLLIFSLFFFSFISPRKKNEARVTRVGRGRRKKDLSGRQSGRQSNQSVTSFVRGRLCVGVEAKRSGKRHHQTQTKQQQ